MSAINKKRTLFGGAFRCAGLAAAAISANAEAGDFVGAVGVNGAYHSFDGGVNWTALPGAPVELYGVVFLDASTGFAVGTYGAYHTFDGGLNWTAETSGLVAVPDLYGVSFLDASTGFAVGRYGAYHTSDGGVSWTAETSGLAASPRLFDVDFVDASTGFAVGLYGAYHTSDGGVSWTAETSGLIPDPRLFGVHFVDASTGFAVGRYGAYRTSDGGVSWTEETSGLAATPGLYGVDFVDASTGFAVGAFGAYHTSDGGMNWTAETSGLIPDPYLYAVDFVDASRGFAVGFYGAYHTFDGGVSWTAETSGLDPSPDIQGVSAFCAPSMTFVASCGDDSWTGETQVCVGPDGPKLTIQAAIDAVSTGDTIVVLPGVYPETIDLLGKAITLRADVPGSVTVAGGGAGSVVTCNSGEGVETVIEGLIITGGTRDGGGFACTDWFNVEGGGGLFVDAASPTIRDCVFDLNDATCVGGGLFMRASESLVEGCTFSSNGNPIGSVGGGLAAVRSEFTLTNCVFDANQALMAGSMFLLESECRMADCTFRDNDASIDGAESVWNQGRLIVEGSNEISPDFGSIATSVGYLQSTTGDPEDAPDSGALVYAVGAGGDVGTLTVNARVVLRGELEVDYQDNPAPPAVTTPILAFSPSGGIGDQWEITDTFGLPITDASAPAFDATGPLTLVTMVIEPSGSEIMFAPPLPPDDASGATEFAFADLDPAPGPGNLDDFIVIKEDGQGVSRVAVYLNTPVGFEPEVFLDTGCDGTGQNCAPVNRFTIADFNCDGFLDIAAYERRGAALVYLLLNDGLGAFTPAGIVLDTGAADGYDAVIAYDAEGDGDDDLLGFRVDGGGAGDAFGVLAENAAPCGTFAAPVEQDLFCPGPICVPGPEETRPFAGPIEISVTLLDTAAGPDRAALFVKETGADGYAIVTVEGFDDFCCSTSVAASGTADGSVPPRAVSADLNGDGEPDYVVTTVVLTPIDASRGRIKVMDGGGGSGLVGGPGALNPDIDIDVEGVPFGVDAVDVDGDGDIDITVGFTPFGGGPGQAVFRTFTGEPPRNSGYRLNTNVANDETAFVDVQAFAFANTLPGSPLPTINVMSGPMQGQFTGLVLAENESRPPCPADLNGDREVDMDDLFIVLTEWEEYGILGLIQVLSSWGACP